MKCMYENGKLMFKNIEDGNYVLITNAENVDVSDGVMKLPDRINEYICSDEFGIEDTGTHLRLIGKNITKEQVGDDIIEKILKDY